MASNRRRLAKQRRVKLFLDAQGFQCSSYDTGIDNGECAKRPDILYEAVSGGTMSLSKWTKTNIRAAPKSVSARGW